MGGGDLPVAVGGAYRISRVHNCSTLIGRVDWVDVRYSKLDRISVLDNFTGSSHVASSRANYTLVLIHSDGEYNRHQ